MFELRTLLKALALPPLNPLLLLGLAWLLKGRLKGPYRHWPTALFLTGFCSLWLLATPIFSLQLNRWVESIEPASVEQLKVSEAKAIVVLTGGQQLYAPEYDSSTTYTDGLLRLRYASYLHRQLQLPLLLTGGKLHPSWPSSLAETMSLDLERSFGLKAKWLEQASRNTAENAQYSYKILAAEQISHIILVTDARHMHRAKHLFEQEGFKVEAAATDFAGQVDWRLSSFIPTTWGLVSSTQALHEILGNLYYSLK